MSRSLDGRYEILEQIGEGGMAVVYKARDTLLNRDVAVKILKPEYTKNVKLVDNFKRESQAAARLVHQNIVGVYDVGRQGNINYIVMELVEGEILSDYIAKNAPLDYKIVVDIGKQIAAGLAFAHKNNVIHKDIKPQNVLLTNEGIAKITDFGIAKIEGRATIVGNADTVMGSVHYFSPEQARGGYVDEKSDIYSLGIVLYEMITGKVPFDGDNPVNIALMQINEEMIPPSKLVDGVPPVLEQIILKATNKIQISRFKTANEMLEALRNVELISSIVGDSVYLNAGIQKDGMIEYSEVEKPEAEEITEYKKSKIIRRTNKEKKKERSNGKPLFSRLQIIAIVAALIFAIPAALFLHGIFSSEKSFRIPDVQGKTVEEARELLQEKGLQLKEGDEVYSKEVDEGKIVSQTPESGKKTKPGKIITVSISKGTKEGTVPNLMGKSFDEAVALINKHGYSVGDVSVKDSDEPKDTVISQNPKAGKTAKAGDTIEFTVSKGKVPGQTNMPKLLGMTLEEAKKAMREAGLEIGSIEETQSTVYPANQIAWQSVASNKDVLEGTKVDIKVSTGSEPKPIVLDIDYSEAKNDVFFITVTVTDENGTFNLISREQRFKADARESVVLSGQGKGSVTVLFDNEVVIKKSVNFANGAID
ncbi:MAG: Stk1 family PASTA domain-containing Ser/Thr kinase [Eubacteriales bacterium]